MKIKLMVGLVTVFCVSTLSVGNVLFSPATQYFLEQEIYTQLRISTSTLTIGHIRDDLEDTVNLIIGIRM